MPFFTFEDAKTSFNLFCCMYGIGTLGMPGNFSRAGPVIAVIAMAFMAFANIYSSVKMSQVILLAPKSVKTFGDLGEWSMGKWGRWLCVISQMGSCLLIPCVFLVLGGSLLDGLFPDAFSATVWIILMALMVLPVCLIPTLKEGAGAAFAGCMGTIIADVIGVAVVMYGMRGHPTVPSPDLKISQVLGCFGNLALAYGAGIVIPDLQPADMEVGLGYAESTTPAIVQTESRRSSKMSYVSVADSEREFKDDPEAEAAEYRGGKNTIKYIALRVVIVAILVVLSIIFQDHFSDFSDFVGASCITTNCILLPIVFYLMKAWRTIPIYEKAAALIVTVVCFVLGCYVTYTTGKSLFTPTNDDTEFPYCGSEYENQIYYNYTAEHES
ncbi:WD repeat-containing protein 35 [Phytophthora nicotianae]|uniref:WD repeat-containing protein 35 n=1 Tax=Phytophthora nicotianae TaxID=4792 RepID=A0A0W8D4H4_PHYNI|nr:WD repeat-containing protein 35 [Phytophthora nicotianae]